MDPDKLVSYTGPRPDVISMIDGTPKRSLDVGCSNGEVSVQIKAQGAETWGIELDPILADQAAARLDRVLVGDALEKVREIQGTGERFDTVICADSLEHMPDPWAVLTVVRDLVTPDGQVIVSLPNVRFYTTLVWLIVKGRWKYLDRGVHDRTHLRWFTDLNARDMFTDAGFRVEAMLPLYRLRDGPGARGNDKAHHFAVGSLKGFLAYQYVYRLRPA